MKGELNLNKLMQNMNPPLHEEIMVYMAIPLAQYQEEIQNKIPKIKPFAIIEEKESTTLILEEQKASKISQDYS